MDDCDPWGILIANGEFTSFTGGFGPDVGEHIQIVVGANNTGAVRISNSAFWGPSNLNARVAGTGSVAFDNSLFNDWDAAATNQSSIHVLAGASVMLRGCEWQRPKPGGQLLIDSGANKVVFMVRLCAAVG